MPIINEGAVKPRVSTVGPVDIPRWENPMGVEVPDFSGLIAPQGGTWEQSKPVITEAPKLTLGDLSLTKDNPLSLDGLTMAAPKAKDWTTAFAPAPKYVPAKLDAAQKSLEDYKKMIAAGGFGGSRSGNLGLGAYGFSGNSGQASQRGTAAFGFQTQMWAALSAANAAMKAAGLGTFGITDGWRSYDAQVALKAKKPTLAATPGRSVHGIGLAADLRLSSAQQKWIDANASKFGLVRLQSEPWHFQLIPSLWK